ncbi:DUF763 domain-containing protein [Thermodesulfobacterium sp. TA1]|uniref:DUF763 domain-containing protein n=1 Tax=Thermodesulfobacterium sp. TA1 TaxID=2234087 RepID=UPI001231D69E|nr:DUF763 domain-containing protein [Thermodesulfobacterium sp. TA1]QER42738.1 DUF763 domain-containing protein [Thermodesulfobacterium sp. TA1]
MVSRSVVDLPLHGGKCPPWLFERMIRLSRAFLLLVYQEFGPKELIKRLTDPFWFQALGCLLGFDWHSSGLTTTVGGAVKEALKPYFRDLGVYVCGGKAKRALNTPQEIIFWGEKEGLPQEASKLVTLSRLTARIDNNAIQDGFQLYFHLFIFSKEGDWGVIQQGMDEKTSYARRYQWYSQKIIDLCENPHAGIVSQIKKQDVLNLVAKESKPVQSCLVNLVKEDFSLVMKELTPKVHLIFKKEHALTPQDLSFKSLRKIWEKVYENPPADFKDLILSQGMGAKALRALTLASELIYEVKASREDPVVYSYAHGGKDGHPYRLNKKLYDNTIQELEEILRKAKLGETEKLEMFRRLPKLFNLV